MNQTELGELAEVTQNEVSAWETGKRLPDDATVVALEELFGSKAPEATALNPDKAAAAPKKEPQPTLEELRAKAPKKKPRKKGKTETTDYRHDGETRTNIPPAKIAAEGTVPKVEKAKYAYNPHLPPVLRFDPTGAADRLQDLIAEAGRRQLTEAEQSELREATSHYDPWLEWAGKREAQERGDFEVDPVALHIHERVAAQAIVRTAMREDIQRDLFADPEQPYQEAVQFYRHDVDWANRLILGDSLQVMSSLARREGLVGQVQMVYMDPPYGIKFGSNFQPVVGKRDVREKETDLTREPEMVRAFRDTWHLGVHSYLPYLRDRLVGARELLAESGSIFVQISDDHVHRVRAVMDEVFGSQSFCSLICVRKTAGASSPYAKTNVIASVSDYLLWYCKNPADIKYRQLYRRKPRPKRGSIGMYQWVQDSRSGERRRIGRNEAVSSDLQIFRIDNLTSSGYVSTCTFDADFEGQLTLLPRRLHWKTNRGGMRRLEGAGRVIRSGRSLAYVRYLDDFDVVPLNNSWEDTASGGFTGEKLYVVQTNSKVIERCILMTTDPGDLVVDPTCGAGTTAVAAEQWGRRWVTIDTSRVAVAIARQRLLCEKFTHHASRGGSRGPHEDPGTGFKYQVSAHITLGSITKNTNLDPILEKHQGVLEECATACNAALAGVSGGIRSKLADKLAHKQRSEGKNAVTEADQRRWLLPPQNRDRSEKTRGKTTTDFDAQAWYEWEIPFDTDPDWPEELREAVEAYRLGWLSKMNEVNECIAANGDQVELVDQPEPTKGVLRVSGPFTVEGVRPEELSIGEEGLFDGTPNTFDESAGKDVDPLPQSDPQNLTAYLTRMVQLLRSDGVTFPNNQHRKLARIEPLFESSDSGGELIHAEAIWDGEDDDTANHVGIGFGPQYGPVTALQVEELIRASRRYDELVIAGFSFDASASGVIQESSHPRLRIHQAYIRPDVNPAMDGFLKETPNSQLFTVFGQPEISTSQNGDGEWVCELVGVDIYDPLTSEVKSTGASKVAAWFLDQDYDGRCFCTTQAFFPDQKAWDKIAKALGSSADPEAFAAFEGTESLPFKAGKYNRLAVKVIDPRGNEVMAIHELGEGG
ncbi:MAG: helix-turn-helix domain-containing protein [bacterium]|nr:helix-turn-helix domain-containing protein [bacterium]